MNFSDLTFAESLLYSTDDCGQIPWELASAAAALHGLTAAFLSEYAALIGEGVDAGEFLVWMGY